MRVKVVLIAVALTLAGCNQQPAGQETADPAASDAATTPPAESGDAVPAGPDFRLDQPIAKEDIRTTLTLAAPPAYRASDDTLLLQVEVGNQGRTALVSQGEMPVQLGVTLAGPDGVDKAPGRRDFVRAKLPLVQPGSTATVGVAVPAADILGLAVNAELVQERVAWLGRKFQQPVLEIGTFQRCDGGENTLCDASGVPVTPAPPAAERPAALPAAPQQG